MKRIGIIVFILLIFGVGLTPLGYSKFEPRLGRDGCRGQPPFFSIPPPADTLWVREGDTLQFELKAEDPDGEVVNLFAYGLPSQSDFQNLGGGRGKFVYCPDFYQAYGIYYPHFVALDNEGCTDVVSSTIFLLDVNQPPWFSPPLPDTITLLEEEVLVDTLWASDPTDPERGRLTILITDTLSLPEEFNFKAYPYKGMGIINFSPGYNFSYQRPGGILKVEFYLIDRQGLSSDTQSVIFRVRNLNRPPSLEIDPDSLSLVAGDTVVISLFAADPDSDDQLNIEAVPFPEGAELEFDPQAGEGTFSWVTTIQDTGLNRIAFLCDDGQGGKDSLTANIWVESPICFILRIPDFEGWPGQREVHLPIYMDNCDYIGGFNILITYDVTVADLVGVQAHYSMESFSFNIVGEKVRIVGICDLPNAYRTPPIPPGKSRPLADLILNLNSDFSDFKVPVKFVTENCGDNVLTDSLGLYMWGTDPTCPPETIPGNPHPNPSLTLIDGSIYLGEVQKGDVNSDGLAYTIADAVYFSEYLIGTVTLTDPPRQGAASDINGDGRFWTIADLVMLVNILNGHIPPPSKISTSFEEVVVNLLENSGSLAVEPNLTSPLRGAYFIFSHQGRMGSPLLTTRSQGMTLVANDDGERLRVVLYSLEEQKIAGGDGPIMIIPVEGEISLEKAEFADEDGNLIYGKANLVTNHPEAISLSQNYPNPFNSATAISYRLSAINGQQTAVHLWIYNTTGQLVRTLVDERQGTGVHSGVWDGRNAQGQEVGSGIYLYRLKVGDRVLSRKMVLLR